MLKSNDRNKIGLKYFFILICIKLGISYFKIGNSNIKIEDSNCNLGKSNFEVCISGNLSLIRFLTTQLFYYRWCISLQESSTTNNSTPQPLASTTQTQNPSANQDTTVQETTSAAIGKPLMWWRHLSFNNNYRFFLQFYRKFVFVLFWVLDTELTISQELAFLECINGCSCPVITDQFSTGTELYSGGSTTYACKQGYDGRIWTVCLFASFQEKKINLNKMNPVKRS